MGVTTTAVTMKDCIRALREGEKAWAAGREAPEVSKRPSKEWLSENCPYPPGPLADNWADGAHEAAEDALSYLYEG